MLLKAFLLIAFIKVLQATHKPALCAGFYAGIALAFLLLFSQDDLPMLAVLVAGAIIFGAAFLYFWLLDKFEDSGLWYVILVVGMLGMIFL